MPENRNYDNEERKRKDRIKKMKAKTSKMRLAVSSFKKSNPTVKYPDKGDLVSVNDQSFKSLKDFEDYVAKEDRPTFGGERPSGVTALRKQRAKTKKE